MPLALLDACEFSNGLRCLELEHARERIDEPKGTDDAHQRLEGALPFGFEVLHRAARHAGAGREFNLRQVLCEALGLEAEAKLARDLSIRGKSKVQYVGHKMEIVATMPNILLVQWTVVNGYNTHYLGHKLDINDPMRNILVVAHEPPLSWTYLERRRKAEARTVIGWS